MRNHDLKPLTAGTQYSDHYPAIQFRLRARKFLEIFSFRTPIFPFSIHSIQIFSRIQPSALFRPSSPKQNSPHSNASKQPTLPLTTSRSDTPPLSQALASFHCHQEQSAHLISLPYLQKRGQCWVCSRPCQSLHLKCGGFVHRRRSTEMTD